MPTRRRFIHKCGSLVFATALLLALVTVSAPLQAQKKGQPGKFDFYLLNLPWGPQFCSIVGVSPQCKPQPGFVVHGLWAQNDDGGYPVFCSNQRGPAQPAVNLDITPDLELLHHEWAKHGTCSNVGPQRFFALEHRAFHSIRIPSVFNGIDHPTSMSPTRILNLFYAANPQLPPGSLLVSCRKDTFTAIEACFTKNLKPMRCLGLHSCTQPKLRVAPFNSN